MKRAFVLFSLLAVAPLARGQDASAAWRDELTENYKILKNTVADQKETIELQRKAIEQLRGDLSDLRRKLDKPAGNFASADDLQVLKDAIQDEAKKRQADEEKILNEITKQIKGLAKITPAPPSGDGVAMTTHGDGAVMGSRGSGAPPVARNQPRTDHVEPVAAPGGDQPGFKYEVKEGDNPAKIARKLFQEKGIHISADEILKANPSIKDPKHDMYIGQQIFIPLKPDAAPAVR